MLYMVTVVDVRALYSSFRKQLALLSLPEQILGFSFIVWIKTHSWFKLQRFNSLSCNFFSLQWDKLIKLSWFASLKELWLDCAQAVSALETLKSFKVFCWSFNFWWVSTYIYKLIFWLFLYVYGHLNLDIGFHQRLESGHCLAWLADWALLDWAHVIRDFLDYEQFFALFLQWCVQKLRKVYHLVCLWIQRLL